MPMLFPPRFDFRSVFRATLVAVLLIPLAGVSVAGADGVSRAGKLASGHEDAVITVKAITRISIMVGGKEVSKTEDAVETPATIIDPSGLAVLSSSRIDPSKLYKQIIDKLKSGQEQAKFEVQTTISDIKMLTAGGDELPAKLVMRDKDMDLAFVKPAKAPASPMPWLDLSDSSKPDMLSRVVILTRLGKPAGYIPSLSLYRVEAVIKKPSVFYMTDQNIMQGKLGAPAFTLDGKPAGIVVLRFNNVGQKISSMDRIFYGLDGFGMFPVIIPSAQVLSEAKHILSTKK